MLQEKERLMHGKLEFYLKPRVTHNMSSLLLELRGQRCGVTTNVGVPREQKCLVVMPRPQEYTMVQAICVRAMAESGLRAPS